MVRIKSRENYHRNNITIESLLDWKYHLSEGSADFNDYDKFKSSCPKTTGGQTATAIMNGAGAIVADKIGSVGPQPDELANFVSKSLNGFGKCEESGKKFFENAMDEIKNDLKNDNPVIALIAWGPLHMHYVNIVAVSEKDDVAVLDTNNSLYYYNIYEFEDLCDCSSYTPHKMVLSNFNIIRFKDC